MNQTTTNWTAEAAKAAVYAAKKHQSEHHGAISWAEPGIAAVFGNDGYCDNYASQVVVGLVREKLREVAIPVLGFGLDPDGNTWTLIVEKSDLDHLREIVASAWEAASESDPNDLEWQLLKKLRTVEDCKPKADVGG